MTTTDLLLCVILLFGVILMNRKVKHSKKGKQ